MAMVFPGLPGLPLPFRLRGIGVGHRQEPIRRPQGYPRHQWIQVRAGRLDLEVGGSTAAAHPGDGLYLRPDEPHFYRSGRGEDAVVDWLNFDGDGVEGALAGGPLTRSGVYRLTSTLALDEVIARAWSGASASSGAMLSAAVYELLMVLTEVAAGSGQVSTVTGLGRLEPVLAALAHRPAHPWDSEALAALIGVTPQHLSRLFGRALGRSPGEYLLRLRLNRAQQLLLERPDLRVHEVGTSVGYPDANYFIRVFKSREGITPGEFRKLHGASVIP